MQCHWSNLEASFLALVQWLHEAFRPTGDNDVHTCDDRNVIYGTAAFSVGAFGLACASVVVRSLVEGS